MKARSRTRTQSRRRTGGYSTRTAARRSTTGSSRRSRSTRTSGGSRRSSTSGRSGQTTKGRRSGRRQSRGQTTGRRGQSARAITDHDEIRRWVEERGGHPAIVERSARSNKGEGILRIDFPGFSGEGTLKPVSWEEWFRVFDERRLAFLYQGRTAGGKPSRFNKLIARR